VKIGWQVSHTNVMVEHTVHTITYSVWEEACKWRRGEVHSYYCDIHCILTDRWEGVGACPPVPLLLRLCV